MATDQPANGKDKGGGAELIFALGGAIIIGGAIYLFTKKPAAATVPTPPPTITHKECVGGVCTDVQGAGANVCNSSLECCTPGTLGTFKHYECSGLACVQKTNYCKANGTWQTTDLCNTDTTCWMGAGRLSYMPTSLSITPNVQGQGMIGAMIPVSEDRNTTILGFKGGVVYHMTDWSGVMTVEVRDYSGRGVPNATVWITTDGNPYIGHRILKKDGSYWIDGWVRCSKTIMAITDAEGKAYVEWVEVRDPGSGAYTTMAITVEIMDTTGAWRSYNPPLRQNYAITLLGGSYITVDSWVKALATVVEIMVAADIMVATLGAATPLVAAGWTAATVQALAINNAVIGFFVANGIIPALIPADGTPASIESSAKHYGGYVDGSC